MAEARVHRVGPWRCKQLPRRLALQRQYTNCTKLNIPVIIKATWKPWKKSTTPAPGVFTVDVPMEISAATTIGQHQAPMIAGRDRHMTPMAPANCKQLIG
jgi:hypothetical protein